MKKLLLVLAFLVVSTPSFAVKSADIAQGLSDLSPQQQADIKAQIAKTQADNMKKAGEVVQPVKTAVPPAPIVTAQRMTEWAQVGQQLGIALAGTAKELGVVANDFVKSPVGMLTAGLIIYHYAGKDLIRYALHFIGGGLFVLLYFGAWFYLVHRVMLVDAVRYEESPVEIGPFKFLRKIKKVTYRNWNDFRSEEIALATLSALAGAIASIMIIFVTS